MSEQTQPPLEEPLEQGPVEEAGPASGGSAEPAVEAVATEEPSTEATGGEDPVAETAPHEEPAAEPTGGGEPQAEPEAAADGGEPQAEPEPEETPLERAERERAEYLELAQRSRAEFENFRKRAAAQAAEAELRGKAALARGLVPALDNLERALGAAGVDPRAEALPDDGDALANGVALVYRELVDALAAVGVEGFDPRGERFDPVLHEAISTIPSESAESGSIVETLERGYRIGSQVLRPARVVVAG